MLYDTSMSRKKYTSVRITKEMHYELLKRAKREGRSVIATIGALLGV